MLLLVAVVETRTLFYTHARTNKHKLLAALVIGLVLCARRPLISGRVVYRSRSDPLGVRWKMIWRNQTKQGDRGDGRVFVRSVVVVVAE